MATAISRLTLQEFRSRYGELKPHFEYWLGEAIQKTVPTWLHGLLQQILGEFFTSAGYKAGPELELWIDPDWQPKPDVVAAIEVELPYPIQAVDVVAEVLAPEDRMLHVYRKCREYNRIGIRAIFVLDPEFQIAWQWSATNQNLERIDDMILPNGQNIALQAIWQELNHRSGKS